jgi:hypothetical protein
MGRGLWTLFRADQNKARMIELQVGNIFCVLCHRRARRRLSGFSLGRFLLWRLVELAHRSLVRTNILVLAIRGVANWAGFVFRDLARGSVGAYGPRLTFMQFPVIAHAMIPAMAKDSSSFESCITRAQGKRDETWRCIISEVILASTNGPHPPLSSTLLFLICS